METPIHGLGQSDEIAPIDIWDNSELLGIENCDGNGISLASIYTPQFGHGSSSFPMDADYSDLATTVVNADAGDDEAPRSQGHSQMFVHFKGTLPSVKNSTMEMDIDEQEEEEDQYLNFATREDGSTTGENVNTWRIGYCGELESEQPMTVVGVEVDEIDKEARRARARIEVSPARSDTSAASKHSVAAPSIAASDSTFVPDALSSSSEESSSDSDDEYVPSSAPRTKSKKPKGRRRGRASTSTRPTPKPKTPKTPRASLRPRRNRRTTISSVGSPPPAKRIKLEPKPTPLRQSAKRVTFLNDPHAPGNSDDEVFVDTTDYGWEYSEYDDLAPIDQIVENCTYALDSEFYAHVQHLAYLDESEPIWPTAMGKPAART